MKLTIEKSDLHRGLSRLQAVVEKRSSMPILANVLLTVAGTLISDLLLAWIDPRIRYQ